MMLSTVLIFRHTPVSSSIKSLLCKETVAFLSILYGQIILPSKLKPLAPCLPLMWFIPNRRPAGQKNSPVAAARSQIKDLGVPCMGAVDQIKDLDSAAVSPQGHYCILSVFFVRQFLYYLEFVPEALQGKDYVVV